MRYLNYAVLSAVIGTAMLGGCTSDSTTGPNNQPPGDTNGGSGTVTTGRLSFWTDYQGAITVSVDGSPVGTTTATYATAPDCGQSGTVTVTVSAGSHIVGGSGGGNNWSGNTTVAAGGCTVYRFAAPTPPPQTTGQLSVWTNYPNQVAVRIDGTSFGTLTTYFPTSPPTCGQAGTLTITLPAGAHAVGGTSGTVTWNSSANVVAGQCTLFELIAPAGGASTGQLSIWTNYQSQIAVKVDGTPIGSTTTYFPNGPPACGQSGTVTVTLPAGAHSITGSSGVLTWNGTATVVAGQCTLFVLNAPAAGGTGQVSVWTNYSNQISVSLDGSPIGTTTSYFPNGPPTCGQAGTLTVTVPAGTHSVAGFSGGLTWNGTVTVVAGQCTPFELNAPSGGSGGSGQLSIWTNYPNQVTVRVDGVIVGTTTQYFATGTPNCGQAGTITVTLPAGAHTVSAVSGTVTWNSSATVAANQCNLFELRSP